MQHHPSGLVLVHIHNVRSAHIHVFILLLLLKYLMCLVIPEQF